MCYENNSLFDFLLQRFAFYKHLQVIFSTEKQEFEKRTQMHVNLECSSRKYKSFRDIVDSHIGKHITKCIPYNL